MSNKVKIVPDAKFPADLRVCLGGRCIAKVYGIDAEPDLETARRLAAAIQNRPVAWRWRYVRAGKAHWTVCQSPRESMPARPGFVAIEAQPLYAAPEIE